MPEQSPVRSQRRGSFRIARIAGIELRLHYSWIIIAVLITASLIAQFRYTNPAWGSTAIWISAIVTGVLFFVGLILHELSHAMVAKSRGLPVERITLFLLGGVAQIEKEPATAATEFWMAIAGPLMSVAFAFACLGIAHGAFGWIFWSTPSNPGSAVLVWLGYINFMLAAFNMIPGFPLDGGRVLRSIIWGVTGNVERATRIAATIGQIVGWLFIIYGFFRMFTGYGIGALWLAIIGWFLVQAAGQSLARTEAESVLHDYRVADVMSGDCGRVPENIDLDAFVHSYLLDGGKRCYVVLDQGGRLSGLITPADLRSVERSRWQQTHVRDVMRPVAQMK